MKYLYSALLLSQQAHAASVAIDGMFDTVNALLAQIIFFDVFPGEPVMPSL